MDEVVETESEGFFSRLMSSIGGIFVGVAMVLIAFPALFCNEGRAVRTAQALTEGAGAAVHVEAGGPDAGNEGRLVHINGKAIAEGTLKDPKFGAEAQNALALRRKVEMYQWQETAKTKKQKKVGGGTKKVTTYTYDTIWSEKAISSSGFNKKAGHENPGAIPFDGGSWWAEPITVGGFTLSKDLADDVNNWQSVTVTDEQLAALDESLKPGLVVVGGDFYKSAAPAAADGTTPAPNPANPVVGDVRITFEANQPAEVSVLGKQTGKNLGAFETSGGYNVADLRMGTMTKDEMFEAAQSENTILTWLIRFGGFGLMWLGLFLIGRPVTVVADILPFLGSLASLAVGVLAFAGAAMCSLPTIAVAWIFYRPLLGIILLVIGLVFMVGLIAAIFMAIAAAKKYRASQAAA